MIKKNKEAATAGQTSNRILGGTRIEGEVHSDGDLRVDGTVQGKVEISGKLVIGEKGLVKGDVKCGSANVSGRFEGNLKVEELLSLEESAQVHGDVLTSKLSVIPGAELSGTCSMGAIVRKMEKENRDKKEDAQGNSERAS